MMFILNRDMWIRIMENPKENCGKFEDLIQPELSSMLYLLSYFLETFCLN